jgi:putative membrane protein
VTSNRERILRRAEFDEKWKTYWFLQITLIFLATVIGIVLVPFWLLGWGVWYCRRYYEHLHCTLYERSLVVGRGIFFRVEKTIPLDKIQDLTLREGPLLKLFGLLSLGIETAGQSSPQGSSEAKLVGIKDARAFRDRVLDQRDALAAGDRGKPSPTVQQKALDDQDQVMGLTEKVVELTEDSNRVLKDILQELKSQRPQGQGTRP